VTTEDEGGRRLAVLDGILAHPATVPSPLRLQIDRLRAALPQLDHEVGRLEVWAHHLAAVLGDHARLLTAGGPLAHHLADEIAGCHRSDRAPFSARCLEAAATRTAALAANVAPEERIARQVRAEGRPGDVLVLIEHAGRSRALVAAAEAGREQGLVVWAITGAGPNALTERCDDAISVIAEAQTVHEVHMVAVDLLCSAFDAEVAAAPGD
jgi:phosphoheptose isomerase